MPKIKPFKAVYYNSKKVKDMNKVVAPPYDVISAEKQEYLHNLSPYNFTHIDLGKDISSDDKVNNKYTRAKKIYSDWLRKNIFLQDEKPSIYFYKQDYKIMGQRHSRMGIVSLLELENEEDSKVYPHEKTHERAIEDRLKLCEHLKSHLSSIFVCYSDKQLRIEKIFNKHILMTEPLIDIEDYDKVHHTLWRLDDPNLINEIDATLSGQELFIADGHHRYKVALEYQHKRLSRVTKSNGREAFNYVMTYFTNIDSRGIQIFPMHRIVKYLNKPMDFLEEFFLESTRLKEKRNFRYY